MSDAGKHSLIDPPTEDLEDLYENAPCGYLSMQPNGRVFKANSTLAKWLGSPSAQHIVGKRLQDLLTVGTRIFYETHAAPLLRLQGFFNEVSLELRTGGDVLPVLASAIERRNDAGELLFTRLTIVKAVERRRYERELVAAREAAKAAEAKTQELLKLELETSKLREQFIAVLGHDLRNPLASIGGGARLLQKTAPNERDKRILGMMEGSVVRMSALINDVLDFARGRLGGGISLTRDPEVLLGPVLEQIVAELRTGGHHQEILTECALPRAINCDPFRIGQMVSNLVGNALTHGASDEPVRVHAEASDTELEIWVANGGQPISPAAMERLFQPFFRGEVRPSQQGLGLGLHIASEIAKAHGGTLSVSSTPEATRFTFQMPLCKADTGGATI